MLPFCGMAAPPLFSFFGKGLLFFLASGRGFGTGRWVLLAGMCRRGGYRGISLARGLFPHAIRMMRTPSTSSRFFFGGGGLGVS